MSQTLLLITPPFVQLNTPYPATTYIKGFLNTIKTRSYQCDLGIEVILTIFSRQGLTDLFNSIDSEKKVISPNSSRILSLKDNYINTIDAVIHFLQNSNPTLAHRICSRNYLPEAGRFIHSEDLEWAFGTMGTQDKARHLATLYIEDISDFITENVDSNFGFSRYAERISVSASSFDELYNELNNTLTYIDKITIDILRDKIVTVQPTLVGFSVPFPGNLYTALRCGQWIKKNFPNIKCVMGGGYPNTELRLLSDFRVFEFIDFITLDDGEIVIQNLIEHLDGERQQCDLKRTFVCRDNNVIFCNGSSEVDIPQNKTGVPDYSDLPLKQYLSVIETVNPMHRLWSDGRWNKLTLAHGCYWGRCAFCDTSLDYIKRFEPLTSSLICDKIEQLIKQTGETGFHFVDEAAPPALLKSLAIEIIKRKLNITWWTNIRFEKSFTSDLCYLLSESGCIAVSGGLEVASDRLLGLIDKGVTVKQVTKVADHFTQNGIMVHAYLMYGFPTQTAQETIDSLEIVRQLFENGVIQSGFWHHFAMTAHSSVGLNPELFNVKNGTVEKGSFANNELECIDRVGTVHSKFGYGLKTSLYNYMNAVGFDVPLNDWFDFKIPATTIKRNYIGQILDAVEYKQPSPDARIIWLGNKPTYQRVTKTKNKESFNNLVLLFNLKSDVISIQLPENEGLWLYEFVQTITVDKATVTFTGMKQSYEETTGNDFIIFWNNKQMNKIKRKGLVTL